MLFIALSASVLLLLGVLAYVHGHSWTYGLPYHDSFRGGNDPEWRAFGGTWETVNGTMRNNSDERGAKLLIGSHNWRNYSIEADISIMGASGDAGLIIRSSNEEQGVDAYTGYYAGVRKFDNSLVLGRAGHGWMEDALKLKQDGTPGTVWYHLKVLVYGCHVITTATPVGGGSSGTLSVTDKDCIPSGRAGLRSYGSGGVWKNVAIKVATQDDMNAMLDQGKQSNSTSSNDLFLGDREVLGFNAPSPQVEEYPFPSSQNNRAISSLRLMSSAMATTAVIRGNVILTSPLLYVQDNTGGVAVPHPITVPSLKVGDQVEVTGVVKPGDFSSTLERATVRTLWDGEPLPPVMVTVSQAATGAFDGTFIEVESRLLHKQYGPGGTLILDFDAGLQSFRAIMNRGRGDYLFSRLKAGSLLRLRGVCVADSTFTSNLTPFVLMLRSTEDIDVLAGPPWWSAGHLSALAIGFLLLTLIGNLIYRLIESSQLRAVLEERERLAHEMHDTLAQSFAGIGFQLEAIRMGVPDNSLMTHQQLDVASDLVRHSHEEARRSIATLRPEAHGPSDLLAALETCARRMVKGGNVLVTASRIGDSLTIPLRITDTLYRIGQEAIANSIRHSHPSKLDISLEFLAGSIRLTTTDDGGGFIENAAIPGFGVRGMRRRAASISAAFQIKSTPGLGTLVSTTAPVPPKVTLMSWPKVLWVRLRERASHVELVG